MSMIVANRYAQALYQEASVKGCVDEVFASLKHVRDMSRQSIELNSFFNNPVLTYEKQSKVLHALFESSVPALLTVFMDFIASKRRLNLMISVIEAFDHLYNEAHNQIVVKVISAYELDEAFRKRLTDRIAHLTGKKVLGEYVIDQSIIGGIKVWAAGKLYEYSFSNELQDFKRKALQNV